MILQSIRHTPQLLLTALVSSLILLNITPAPAQAATAWGNLTCASSTTNSITVGLAYSGTGTAGASLYRYGAPGNGQVARYPGPTGSGRHVDNGLSGSYRYQLRTGTTVLFSIDCVTKPVASTAPAPAAPTPNPTPQPTPAPAPAPAPAPPAPAPSPVPAPQPSTERQLPSDEEFQIEPLPEAGAAVASPEPDLFQGLVADSSSYLWGLILLPITLLIAAAVFVLRRKKEQSAPLPPRLQLGDIDKLTLPAPVSAVSGASPPVPLPVPAPITNTHQNSDFNRSINRAFYPTRTQNTPVTESASADDIPDMYEIAGKDPRSFGSSQYAGSRAANEMQQPPAGPNVPPRSA